MISRVWKVFIYGLKSARETLVEGKKWKWRDAYNVLKEQLTLTKQAAAEGIEAIKLEAGLYSTAVGQPGLIALQYFIDNLTPKLGSTIIQENIENALREIKNPNIRMIKLEQCNIGSVVPTLMSGRGYDVKDAMALDLDVEWLSKLEAKMKMTTKVGRVNIPVTVKNLRFEGTVRVVLTPLTNEPPGFGAVLISFPKAPSIGLDISVSRMELTKTPWIRDELLKEIQTAVAEQFLWPRRIIIPSGLPPKTIQPMLSKLTLQELESTDPLLRAERRIDDNDLIIKNNIQRDQVKEADVDLDVFVGDEAELLRKLSDVAEEDGSKAKGFRFPWQGVPFFPRDIGV